MSTTPIELMAQARAGQSQALGELCDLYRNYMRMLARAGMGPKLAVRVELSDVVQETMVEVIRQFPQFTGQNEVALIGWFRRLVSQKLADLGRYHSRTKRAGETGAITLDAPVNAGARPADLRENTGERLLDMVALSQTSPSEVASRRELTVMLANALAHLPKPEAEVLWLYHAEGLTFVAIGERLDLNRKVVSAIWARGLRSLRRSLDAPPKAEEEDVMVRRWREEPIRQRLGA